MESRKQILRLAKDIGSTAAAHHLGVSIFFPKQYEDRRIGFLDALQQTSDAARIQFDLSVHPQKIVVLSKPKSTRLPAHGIIERVYQNQVVELISSSKINFYYGVRHFPSFAKEVGAFDKQSRELAHGYCVDGNGVIELRNPHPIVAQKVSLSLERMICEIEYSLSVIEKITAYGDVKCVVIDTPVEDVLMAICSIRPLEQRFSWGDSIAGVLEHKDFGQRCRRFIRHALSTDESGTPRLFSFSYPAVAEVLKAAVALVPLDVCAIVDPRSGRNIFMEAAYRGSLELLASLSHLFPQTFLALGQNVLDALLHHGFRLSTYDKTWNIVGEFVDAGGILTPIQTVLIAIAQKQKLSPDQSEALSSLPLTQQREAYQVAYSYNNPYVYEPSAIPVLPDQYSINVMWVNATVIPNHQEFLFGDGETFEERQADFEKKFVLPVAGWAQKNPGSDINIWIDGAMLTRGALERSCIALEHALVGTVHGRVKWRDIRSLEAVSLHEEAFIKTMPVYFRVDLLRAVVADHVLRQHEVQYFVYGDLDMVPLSRHELFDARTVNFLADYGFVLAKRSGEVGFENGFQIINGEHFQCLASHRKVIIDLTLEMVHDNPSAIEEEQVFESYLPMFVHLLHADGRYGPLVAPDDGTISIFRKDHWPYNFTTALLGKESICARKCAPCKPVRLPPSRFSLPRTLSPKDAISEKEGS
jgi:hypothetical protein